MWSAISAGCKKWSTPILYGTQNICYPAGRNYVVNKILKDNLDMFCILLWVQIAEINQDQFHVKWKLSGAELDEIPL